MNTSIKAQIKRFWQSPDFRTFRAELEYLPALALYFGVFFLGVYLFF